MTPLMIAGLGALMVATAFLSGLFGMAGGLVLIGVLLALMPLPTAMVLHAITQMASNALMPLRKSSRRMRISTLRKTDARTR